MSHFAFSESECFYFDILLYLPQLIYFLVCFLDLFSKPLLLLVVCYLLELLSSLLFQLSRFSFPFHVSSYLSSPLLFPAVYSSLPLSSSFHPHLLCFNFLYLSSSSRVFNSLSSPFTFLAIYFSLVLVPHLHLYLFHPPRVPFLIFPILIACYFVLLQFVFLFIRCSSLNFTSSLLPASVLPFPLTFLTLPCSFHLVYYLIVSLPPSPSIYFRSYTAFDIKRKRYMPQLYCMVG